MRLSGRYHKLVREDLSRWTNVDGSKPMLCRPPYEHRVCPNVATFRLRYEVYRGWCGSTEMSAFLCGDHATEAQHLIDNPKRKTR